MREPSLMSAMNTLNRRLTELELLKPRNLWNLMACGIYLSLWNGNILLLFPTFYFANTKRLTFDAHVISRDKFQKLRRGNMRILLLSNLYLFFFFFSFNDVGKHPISVNFCFSNYRAERSVPDTSFVKINFKKCISVKDLRKDTSTIEFVSIMCVTI